MSDSCSNKHSIIRSPFSVPRDLKPARTSRDTSALARKLKSKSTAAAQRQQPQHQTVGKYGRLPQNGSAGQQAHPVAGGEERASRWPGGRRRGEATEVFGRRGVSCDGRRRGTLLVRRCDERQGQKEGESQHQRSAAFHPGSRSQGEGRSCLKTALYC